MNTGIWTLPTQWDAPTGKQGLWVGQPAVGLMDIWLTLMMRHAQELTATSLKC